MCIIRHKIKLWPLIVWLIPYVLLVINASNGSFVTCKYWTASDSSLAINNRKVGHSSLVNRLILRLNWFGTTSNYLFLFILCYFSARHIFRFSALTHDDRTLLLSIFALIGHGWAIKVRRNIARTVVVTPSLLTCKFVLTFIRVVWIILLKLIEILVIKDVFFEDVR